MKNRKMVALPLAVALSASLTLIGCGGRKSADQAQSSDLPQPQATQETALPPATPIPTAPAPDFDAWLGKWIGPEGTFLVLSKTENRYGIQIQSLDSLDSYEGTAAGDHIEFQRNGATESLRAGSGQETGMKWLLEKKDCLVIRQSEGFCRD